MSEPTKDRIAQSPEIAAPVVLVMNGAGMVVEWTPDAEAIFGWPRADAVGKRLSTLITLSAFAPHMWPVSSIFSPAVRAG